MPTDDDTLTVPVANHRTLRRGGNTAWSIVAIGAYALSQWLLVVVIARLGSPESVGTFALALAIAAPVFMASNMRLRLLQATDMTDRYPFETYLSLRLVTAAAAFAVTMALVGQWHGTLTFYAVVAWVALFKLAEAVQDVSLGRFQQMERMDRVALSTSIAGLLSVVAMAAVFSVTGSLVLACAAIAAVRLAQIVMLDLPRTLAASALRGAGIRDRVVRARSLAAKGWPLGIAAGLDSLNTNAPRYFIAAFDGEAALGVFAAMMQISFAGFALVNAVGQAWVRGLARSFAAGDSTQFWRTATRMIGVAVVVGLVGTLVAAAAGKWLLTFLYGSSFASGESSFVLVMVGGLLSYVALAFAFVFTSIGRQRVQVPLYLSALVVGVTVGWVLVPALGLAGGAWSMILANAAQVLVSAAVLARDPPFQDRSR